jgi:hypothetical protein
MEHRREELASGWRERDDAPERFSPRRLAGLDFDAFNRKLWARLRQDHCCRQRERERGEGGEREGTEKWGRKMMGMLYMVF